MEQDIDDKHRKRKSDWSVFLGFLLILAVCFFLGNIAMFLLAKLGGVPLDEGLDIFSAISNPEYRPYLKTGIGLNHILIFIGTSLLFAYWLKRKNWINYFDFKTLDLHLAVSCFLLLVCAYPLIGVSATILENVEWANQIDESNIDALMSMLQMDSFLDLLVNLLIIALLPAIGEELLFRGVIQKELVFRSGNHHLAIILTSIIFSGVHLQVQGFLPKFFIGMILGYSYFWTKTIWVPMLLHFINNGTQTLILYFIGDKMNTLQKEANQPEILHLVIVVIFSCFLCYLIIRDIKKRIIHNRNINL